MRPRGALGLALVAIAAWMPLAAAGAQRTGASAVPAGRRGVGCERRRGHTILHRGAVRVYLSSGTAWGCVQGSRSTWALWEPGGDGSPAVTGAVGQVAGRFVAVETSSGNQYGSNQALEVFDLRSGASYAIAGQQSPISGSPSGEPPSPGPWPLEAYALAGDGRSARLYDTFAANTTQGYDARPTGQVLDVVGFHHFQHTLASAGPGQIAPASLTYRGDTVGWTQGGSPASASV